MIGDFQQSARRVLLIGPGAEDDALRTAEQLPPDGLLIVIERDAGAAQALRDRLAAAGAGGKASVMIGDPSRYLHKVAGPFDLIACRADNALAPRLDRLVHLLAPGGTLVSRQTADAHDYNRALAAEARLHTTTRDDGGTAISVKPQDA